MEEYSSAEAICLCVRPSLLPCSCHDQEEWPMELKQICSRVMAHIHAVVSEVTIPLSSAHSRECACVFMCTLCTCIVCVCVAFP